MDADTALEFIRSNHRAVLSTSRRDGRPQLTPVTCSVDDGGVVISSREAAAKTLNVRRVPFASVCVFTDNFFGDFVQVEGPVSVVSLPEAMEGLVNYYRSVSGEHPDWDDYRAAMERDQRVLIKIEPARVGPTYSA